MKDIVSLHNLYLPVCKRVDTLYLGLFEETEATMRGDAVTSTQEAAVQPGATSQYAIVAKHLAKRFKSRSGPVKALNGVSFHVEREQVFAILGPNGAGKTTLLRILTTVMRPGAGSAWIEGYELGRQNMQIRNLIGIVAQDNYFDRYLSVWQNLVLHAQMHGLPKSAYEKRISELLERVGLYNRRHDYMDEFSGGMQRRVALIRALIHKPHILFLDEPTTGLDPVARREIWDTIQQLKHDTTVILTTHYMEEADRLSDQIMILNHGEVMMTGTPQELKRHISPPSTYELALSRPEAEHYRTMLVPIVKEALLIDPHALRFTLKSADGLPEVMGKVDPEDFLSLGLAEADLEAVYIAVAGQAASKAEGHQA
jgi:ABC-2 type transport system ATP-binding protein